MDDASLRLGLLDPALHARIGLLVDQRPDQYAIDQRITDRQGLIGRFQARDQLIVNVLMHDQAAERGAALACGADGGEHDRAERHFDIGRRRHDHRVVAAELQNGSAEPFGHLWSDRAPHAGGAGGRDDRHIPAFHQDLAAVVLAHDDLQQSVGRVAELRQSCLEDLQGCQRTQRGLFRRLPDHRVPTDQRQRRVPRPGRHGEVEGGDYAAQAHRMPGLTHRMARALGGYGEPVKLAREANCEVADVDHLLHLAEALLQDLAAFEGDEAAQVLLLRTELLAEQTHQFAPSRGRNGPPSPERFDALGDHRAHLLGRVHLQSGDLRAVDRRVDGERSTGDFGIRMAVGRENVGIRHGVAPSLRRCVAACRPIEPGAGR